MRKNNYIKPKLGTNKSKERKMKHKLGATKHLKSIAKLKKELQIQVNLYARLRDVDSNGYAKCISCGSVKHFTELQGGHFYPGIDVFGFIRFHDWNINAQCGYCNTFLEGNTNEYRKNLINKIGLEAVKWLDENARVKELRSREWYQERIDNYKKLNDELRKMKGL